MRGAPRRRRRCRRGRRLGALGAATSCRPVRPARVDPPPVAVRPRHTAYARDDPAAPAARAAVPRPGAAKPRSTACGPRCSTGTTGRPGRAARASSWPDGSCPTAPPDQHGQAAAMTVLLEAGRPLPARARHAHRPRRLGGLGGPGRVRPRDADPGVDRDPAAGNNLHGHRCGSGARGGLSRRRSPRRAVLETPPRGRAGRAPVGCRRRAGRPRDPAGAAAAARVVPAQPALQPRHPGRPLVRSARAAPGSPATEGAGDAEQHAAAFAFLARLAGFPARVAVGYLLPRPTHGVHGSTSPTPTPGPRSGSPGTAGSLWNRPTPPSARRTRPWWPRPWSCPRHRPRRPPRRLVPHRRPTRLAVPPRGAPPSRSSPSSPPGRGRPDRGGDRRRQGGAPDRRTGDGAARLHGAWAETLDTVGDRAAIGPADQRLRASPALTPDEVASGPGRLRPGSAGPLADWPGWSAPRRSGTSP